MEKDFGGLDKYYKFYALCLPHAYILSSQNIVNIPSGSRRASDFYTVKNKVEKIIPLYI